MIQESQLNINSTETKLLYDIRQEQIKTNELLTSIFNTLCPIRKDTEIKNQIITAEKLFSIEKPNKKSTTKNKAIKPKRSGKNA